VVCNTHKGNQGREGIGRQDKALAGRHSGAMATTSTAGLAVEIERAGFTGCYRPLDGMVGPPRRDSAGRGDAVPAASRNERGGHIYDAMWYRPVVTWPENVVLIDGLRRRRLTTRREAIAGRHWMHH
jgi:hypothetical protein